MSGGDATIPHGRGGFAGADRRPPVLWIVLSAATVALVCSTHFPPFYDYYQWLLQGHVVSVLLFGADSAGAGIAGNYVLSPVPVPNLAAPVVIGTLDAVLPTEAAGQVFAVLAVLGFALAYGHLVRTIQQRATPIEYTGFLWAPGFFLYKGYLSYLVGLALVFVLVAMLHRVTTRAGAPTGARLWALCGLSTVLYLSHLLAWSIGALVVFGYALVLAHRRLRRPAVLLVLTLAPAVVLAAWYVLSEGGGSGITFYGSWFDKAISLTETLQLFLRLDPFPPAFPIFWVNVAAVVAFVALVTLLLDRRALRTALATRPVLWLGGLLAAIAIVLPISMVNDLIKPDERFVLPALLFVVAALPYRAAPALATPAVVALVSAVLGLHAIEYVDVGARIGRLDAVTDGAVPAGAPLLEITIPSRHGCVPASGPTVGVPVLKWFGVDFALETGRTRVNVDETSLVHLRAAGPPDLTVLDIPASDVPAEVRPIAFQYPYLQVNGCSSDLAAVEPGLASRYEGVARGEGFTIFRRTA
ncbi:hypothetical protein [Pseudonocardia sp. MH-G8]|uniref:hypothetical protein n=1 Tax=Pseudonocardia sp. MH-G8 TaxID=1854588 RepID=UPI000BA002B3|nr:hypothetical protein [Pseudonocardia sp. MH-G8]OZM79940.1 hypothetical protein CFP66_23345 [Pseudonocardia sp. MH-G8]